MSRRRLPDQGKNFTVIPGEGRRHSHVKQALVFYLVLGLVAVLVIQAGSQWMGMLFFARRLQITTAEPGFFDYSVAAEGVVTRREQVISAPASGIIVELAPSGERIAVGRHLVTILLLSREDILDLQTEILTEKTLWSRLEQYLRDLWHGAAADQPDQPVVLTGEIPPWFQETVTLSSETAGLLSYYVDGWESLWEEAYLTRELVESAASKTVGDLAVGTFVEAGAPLLKIVNNWSWLYHVILPLDSGRGIAARESVTIVFDYAPDNPVQAVLENMVIDAAASEVRLTYRLDQELPGFDRVRWSSASIRFRQEQGIIIPAPAITAQQGQTGVFINSGGSVVFNPVTVIDYQDNRALVDGLEPYTMVIGRPDLVREGQRLN
ncbi:MAG: HlyD family efflux transporter periplasmic adaptor subunit [Bacillota bacterium]